MRLMIDTNVFLDVLLRREPFFADSRAVLEACFARKAQGFLSASSVTDLFYLLKRHLHDTDETYRAIGYTLDIARVLTVTNEDVLTAFAAKAADFEDCLMAVCARSNRCDAIVTRNKKDFRGFGVTLLSPAEAVELLK